MLAARVESAAEVLPMPRRLVPFLLALVFLAPRASATWSIVVVDRKTGEVGVAGATCVENIYLIGRLPLALPGLGGGVIQASGSFTDLVPMAAGLRARLSPAEVLELVQAAEPVVGELQTGIVALYPGAPVTFSGQGTQAARGGVVGEVGDLAYAIQGNVLAGFAVVTRAEAALLAARGDLGQRLMAAMEAARAYGGDGRCSCTIGPRPNSCGSPPPSFRKTAHGAFVLIARMGDEQPPCLNGGDCQLTSFHLSLNVRGQRPDPDPVLTLAERYAEWRAERAGRPDGLRSRVDAVKSLPADGRTRREVVVRLVDLEGVPLAQGGAVVRVSTLDAAEPHVTLGPVADLGDGRYRFQITAGERAGLDQLVITAEDDLVKATLFPFLEIESVAPAPLHVGRDALSAVAGGEVPFVLARPELAHGAYLLLCSASGETPPTPVGGGVFLPLARDAWLRHTALFAGDPRLLPGTRGFLDADGRAEAALRAPPGALVPLIGRRLSWAALIESNGRRATTAAVGFEVVP
jgi:hypothetical protein